jgi:hypothetical protein
LTGQDEQGSDHPSIILILCRLETCTVSFHAQLSL